MALPHHPQRPTPILRANVADESDDATQICYNISFLLLSFSSDSWVDERG